MALDAMLGSRRRQLREEIATDSSGQQRALARRIAVALNDVTSPNRSSTALLAPHCQHRPNGILADVNSLYLAATFGH